MKCPRCQKNGANEDMLYGLLPCDECLNEDKKTSITSLPRFATQSQSDRVRSENDKYSKDLVQPWVKGTSMNQDFARLYPKKAEEIFTKKELEKI